MSHYFEDIKREEKDYFFIEGYINNKKYKFKSCNNVFSKKEVDYGSNLLIKTIINNYNDLGTKVLDMGCGYGAIGISLADQYKNTHFVLTDITKTATRLAKDNLHHNNITNAEVINGNLYENVSGSFDFIITNPPISAGKKVLFEIVDKAYEHLEKEGQLILVVKKKHGQESMKKHMEAVFGNTEVLKRDKGYYIIASTKYED